MSTTLATLPPHLRKYIVAQDDQKYSPVDHSVWRYILRQLRSYLSVHAHETYVEGLDRTGIQIERIPRIDEISRKISNFGWRALPVSGFIPPAAFMELQALGVLPIASDVRSLEHLLYTPAPDIVHEAAGHAPMLANHEFSSYLQKYAQIARKAIISSEDMNVYKAIRNLSDIKENPASSPEAIAKAEGELATAVADSKIVSEATWLSRMNWWTAEYGLIGTLENPRIYGAGLLSSVGEAKLCLSDKVQKIPFSIDCINYSYDITEPQPQLFVTPDFQTLIDALDELAAKMAFRLGGAEGLRRAIEARTVNTVELNSGLQISGVATEPVLDENGELAYLSFRGPTQLSLNDKQVAGHGVDYHKEGFGTPIGFLKSFPETAPSDLTDKQWVELGALPGQPMELQFTSGVVVTGIFESRTKNKQQTVILTFKDARAMLGDRVLFDPAWGVFDMAVGSQIVSVFGGPADRQSYGDVEDFVAARVEKRASTSEELQRFEAFELVRRLREAGEGFGDMESRLHSLMITHQQQMPDDWLFFLELYELALSNNASESLKSELRATLEGIAQRAPTQSQVINDGIALSAVR